jgi:hypothetical protein
LHIKRGADGNYDADHEEIAIGPLELGHVLEIHPLDSGNDGRYGQDGGPRREPACMARTQQLIRSYVPFIVRL